MNKNIRNKTIKEILENEEVIDIAKTAEAIIVDKKRKSKLIKPKTNSTAGWDKLKVIAQEEESFRQKLAKVWNKKI
jgi:hypothetical protein